MKSCPVVFFIFILGVLSKNRMISISSGVLLVFSYLGFLPKSVSTQNMLIEVGIVLLVMGVLIPLSTGELSFCDLYKSIISFEGLVSFFVGIFAAVMARNGVVLMKDTPGIMTSLLLGSIIGTAFFDGIPTGPLVAAGLAAFFIKFSQRIFRH
ncbi:MAG TPA: DUF441 domain-containing protein [Thermoanaerobacterales bacterium]|nr:DUF441 domain-containing protein [Thermoanaerobacterales bacterium]